MERSRLHFELVTPYGMFIESKSCEMAVLNAYDGQLAVQYGHMPLIVAIIPGLCRFYDEKGVHNCFASHGYAVIEPEEVTLIVSAAEWPEEIDVERAKESIRRAKEKLEHKEERSPQQLSAAEHAVRRSKARIHIAENYRRDGESSAKE